MLPATCLAKGGSQRGPGVVLSTIQSHAHHGGCLSIRGQKSWLVNHSWSYVDYMYSSVPRVVEDEDFTWINVGKYQYGKRFQMFNQ